MKDLSHVDASYDNVDPCIWSIVENSVGELIYSTRSKQILADVIHLKALSALVYPHYDLYTPRRPGTLLSVERILQSLFKTFRGIEQSEALE